MMGGSATPLPPSVVLSPPESSAQQTPAQTPSRSMSMSHSGHQQTSMHSAMSFMQGQGSDGKNKPGSSPAMGPSSSVQKRRNSGTPTLHLSPAPAALASPVGPSAMAGTSNSARKPPTYPSNPNTPSMLGRSLPLNIGSGSGGSGGGGGGNNSRRGSYSHSHTSGGLLAVPSSVHGGGGGSQGPSLTPPGTPQVLPVPRSMLPQSPLTPALGPNHTIAVATKDGMRRVGVSPRQLGQYMSEVDNMALPPQAAPNHQQQHHHQQHNNHAHGHRGNNHNNHSHHHHGHNAHQSAAQSPSAKPQQQHARTASPAASQSQQPQQQQQAPSPTQSSQASPKQSSPRVHAHSPAFHHAPVTPVKHLVKLSSLSSLSTLIAPVASAAAAAATASATTPASASSPRSSPRSPPTASPVSSPRASPTHSARSPALSPRQAPVLLPAPPALPPTYIILDIDETIHINAHAPVSVACARYTSLLLEFALFSFFFFF